MIVGLEHCVAIAVVFASIWLHATTYDDTTIASDARLDDVTVLESLLIV